MCIRDRINDAVKTSKGNVVVVEKGMKLTYDIAPAARRIDLDEYKICLLYTSDFGTAFGLLWDALTGCES